MFNPTTGKVETVGQVGKQLFLQTEKENEGVHHFELYDMTDVQYNPNYQFNALNSYYHVQIKVQDGVDFVLRNALSSILNEMSPALDRYNTYANIAGAFDYKVNKFNDIFKDSDLVQQDYETIKNNINIMIDAVQILAAPHITKQTILGDLSVVFEPYAKFKTKISTLTSPNYGNPSGIANLIEIKNQVASILQNIFGMNPSNKKATAPDKNNAPGSTMMSEFSFDFKRWPFWNPSTIPYKNMGYDFLSDVPLDKYVDYPPDSIKSQEKVFQDQIQPIVTGKQN